ncbi:MAG TPA: glycosyltransferase [Blastocatellia bacterium]|nr:glycosyltransferase [Blastocatellia bacterium]
MPDVYDISVVIGTRNRAKMLDKALDSVLHQESKGARVRYEVIVVDNNSSDGTREVVERYIKQGARDLKYLFEEKQGVSYARNCGVANADAPIIAFTDDDVFVTKEWVANIKTVFDRHPEIGFLGGKILPRWKAPPPAWLNRDHWWALSLLDSGDQPFYVDAANPLCLPTANASFRTDLFRRFGNFSPDFSGREDHEFLLRLWCAGVRGMYAPSVVVTAEVQPERLRRRYHRKWNTTTGRFNSNMRLNEKMGSDGRIVGEAPDAVTLFGVPAFIYRNLLTGGLGLISSTLLGQQAASLRHRNGLYYLIGYIHQRYAQNASACGRSDISEIGTFVKALLKKKLNRKQTKHNDSLSLREACAPIKFATNSRKDQR